MISLKENLIKQIQNLRKKGFSYKELAEKFNISKSTAYKYSSSIKLTNKSMKIISKKIEKRQKEFVQNYARLKDLPKKINWSISKIRIISHCLFDGSVSENVTKYTNSSKALIDQFVEDVFSVYGINPSRIEILAGKHLNKYTVYFCSKRLCLDLFKYTPSYSTSSKKAKIPNKVFSSSNEEISEFLRAFWEDEGCVTIKGEILGRIKSKKVRDQLFKLHKMLDINCRKYNCSDNMFGIRIIRRNDNLKKFEKVCFEKSRIVRGFNIGKLKKSLFYKTWL